MMTVYVVVSVLTVLAVGGIAAADLAGARFVLANAAAVDLPSSWITPLGLLKAAGALGLAAGLLGVPLIGPAAAAGLVAFFVGAVVAHLRAGDHSAALLFPLAYLALATVSLAGALSL